MDVWSIMKEVEGGTVRIKALALRSELAKHGLTSEEDVRRTWETAISEAMRKGNGSHIRVTSVKFLNVYCLVEMEASRKNGASLNERLLGHFELP